MLSACGELKPVHESLKALCCVFTYFVLIVSVCALDSVAQARIEYFGYYASAMNGSGTGNYIDAVSSFSNTVFIRGGTTSEVVAKLKDAKAHNMSAIVMVQNVLFPWSSSKLYPDADVRFKEFHDQILPYESTIASYYVFD